VSYARRGVQKSPLGQTFPLRPFPPCRKFPVPVSSGPLLCLGRCGWRVRLGPGSARLRLFITWHNPFSGPAVWARSGVDTPDIELCRGCRRSQKWFDLASSLIKSPPVGSIFSLHLLVEALGKVVSLSSSTRPIQGGGFETCCLFAWESSRPPRR